MGNVIRNIFYTGLAASVGVIGYIAGKSRHWKGISLTTMGLAFILYTPRGCDLLEKTAIIRGEVAKAKIYKEYRSDSLDSFVQKRSDSSSLVYVKNALNGVIDLEKNIENSYNLLLKNTEEKYEKMMEENELDYSLALKNMQKQNDVLNKNIDALRSLQKQANSIQANLDKAYDKRMVPSQKDDVSKKEMYQTQNSSHRTQNSVQANNALSSASADDVPDDVPIVKAMTESDGNYGSSGMMDKSENGSRVQAKTTVTIDRSGYPWFRGRR